MNINDKYIENLCKNIKLMRTQNNFTQQEMAKILGIGLSSLKKLEEGTVPSLLGINILFIINNIFGVAPASIFLDPFEK